MDVLTGKGKGKNKSSLYLITFIYLAVILGFLLYNQLPAFAADTTPPTFVKAEASSKQTVYLTFSEPVKQNVGSISIAGNGNPDLTVTSVTYASDARILRLTVSTQVTGNKYSTPNYYTVTVNGIQDLAGNTISPNPSSQNFDAFTPHGKYSPYPVTSGNSNRQCGQCHLSHSATGYDLLNRTTIKKVCFVCHGNAGPSEYKVEKEFTSWVEGGGYSTSMHKSLDAEDGGNNILTCVDCHDPHGIRRSGADIYPKLLRSKNVYGAVYNSGTNWFCLACHGFGDVNSQYGNRFGTYWNDTGGDHKTNPQGFEGMSVASGVYNAVHYDAVNFASYLNPKSGTNITCVTCHERHGSKNTRLVDNVYYDSSYGDAREKLCYKCHNTTTLNSMNNVPIKQKFDVVEDGAKSKHTITNTVYGFSCSSCHGPHTVARRTFANSSSTLPSDISNPENTKNNWYKAAGQDMSGFCNKCHDTASGQTLVQTINANTIVPYSVSLPSTVFTSNAGGWNKKTYYDASSASKSGHYTNTNAGMCDKCHDPHGSNNYRMLLKPRDTSTTDGICLQCHNGSVAGAPNVKSKFTNAGSGNNFTYRHPTLYDTVYHSDTETFPWSTANRHASCYDCHDPHAVNSSTATAPNITGDLLNVTGANTPTAPASWPAAWSSTGFTYTLGAARYQYDVCFKCHTSYNGNFPAAPGGNYTISNQSGSMPETNLAQEFNPNNPSYHKVISGAADKTWANLSTNTFVTGTFTRTSTLYCTNCHGVENTSVTAAGHVHGSTNKYMLKYPWSPLYGGGYNNGTLQTMVWGQVAPADFLCFQCHNKTHYGGSTTNSPGGSTNNGTGFSSGSNNYHGSKKHGLYPCTACHSAVVHGWKRPRMLVSSGGLLNTGTTGGYNAAQEDEYPYNVWRGANTATYERLYIETTNNLSTKSGAWSQNDCSCSGGH